MAVDYEDKNIDNKEPGLEPFMSLIEPWAWDYFKKYFVEYSLPVEAVVNEVRQLYGDLYANDLKKVAIHPHGILTFKELLYKYPHIISNQNQLLALESLSQIMQGEQVQTQQFHAYKYYCDFLMHISTVLHETKSQGYYYSSVDMYTSSNQKGLQQFMENFIFDFNIFIQLLSESLPSNRLSLLKDERTQVVPGRYIGRVVYKLENIVLASVWGTEWNTMPTRYPTTIYGELINFKF